MKPALKLLLKEFTERDFEINEMYEVIYALHDVKEDQRQQEVNRKHDEIEMVQ